MKKVVRKICVKVMKNAFSIIVFRIADRFWSILNADKVLLTSYGYI